MRSLAAVRLALAWMTVLPTGTTGSPDRAAAGRAMTALPAVGLVCGLAATATSHGIVALGGSALLGGALGVVVLVALTRGMHVDALADTADALGSYAGPEGAREIMRSGTVGPMGAAAVALALLVESAALTRLVENGAWAAPVAALVLSRCLPVAQLRGVPAATDTGFGALVAGSQSRAAVVATGLLAAVAGACCALGAGGQPVDWWRPVLGAVLGAALYAAAAAIARRHVARRLGGVSGDVLGATVESGCAAALTAAALLT